jgi:hypothetical protein
MKHKYGVKKRNGSARIYTQSSSIEYGEFAMAYTVDWIGTVALGVLEDGNPRFALALEEGQEVPPEFHVGDELRIVNRPAHPAMVAMGINQGYYEVTHVTSGTTSRILHRVYA